eukprot:1141728-Pelagomonas_calceolata.AAC.1
MHARTGTHIYTHIHNAHSVPAEALKKAAKERKAVLDEAQQAIASALTPPEPGSSADKQADRLDALGHNLQGLKRKLGDVSRAEGAEAGRCKARLEHLQNLTLPKPSAVAWNKQRLDRLLCVCVCARDLNRSACSCACVHVRASMHVRIPGHLLLVHRAVPWHMKCVTLLACSMSQSQNSSADFDGLRSGYQQAASFLASSSNIEELVDSHIFKDAKKASACMLVIDALRRHDCSEALAWCAEQRPRLKKAKSKLEFQLRVQHACCMSAAWLSAGT